MRETTTPPGMASTTRSTAPPVAAPAADPIPAATAAAAPAPAVPALAADASPEQQLFAALGQFQAVAYGAPKDATNPHFHKTYATLASVLAAIQPATQFGLSHTVVFEPGDGCTRLVATLHHVAGASIRSELLLAMGADWQRNGSAMTYARRYALMALYGLAPEDDDANLAAAPQPQRQQRQGSPPRTAQRQAQGRPATGRPVQQAPAHQQAQSPAPPTADLADLLAAARAAIANSGLTIEGVHTLILQATEGKGTQLEDLRPAFLRALPGVVRTPQSVERLNQGLDTRTGRPVVESFPAEAAQAPQATAEPEEVAEPEEEGQPDDEPPATWAVTTPAAAAA